jgi:hypothetical protein
VEKGNGERKERRRQFWKDHTGSQTDPINLVKAVWQPQNIPENIRSEKDRK